MRFLTTDQKQQRVNVCEELRQIAPDVATFLSRFITSNHSLIYGYDLKIKQQSSQWKSQNLQTPKQARQVRSEVENMLIILFNIKRIVHREFIVAGQTVNSSYYCNVL
jgi:hypothetical protein